MINRILLRIKVIQILFSYYKSNGKDVNDAKNELSISLDKTYELYMLLLRLAVEVCDYAKTRKESIAKRCKMAGDANFDSGEKIPADFLAENKVALQLAENQTLNKFLEDNKLSWNKHPEIINSLYADALASQAYEIAEASEHDYDCDRRFLRGFYKSVVTSNPMLTDELEGMSIYWNDDTETVISFIMKTIARYEETTPNDYELMPKFSDPADESFGLTLLTKVIYNQTEYDELITEHIKNWDKDRVAFMDRIILQTAIAELFAFPQIPIVVTLNEYVELSKYYSTPRSSTFINGVLDAIVKDLKEKNKLTKVAVITPKTR